MTTSTRTTVSTCPDCGGELQSTRQDYMSGVVITLDEAGCIRSIEDDGRYYASGDTHVYCENDCPRWER